MRVLVVEDEERLAEGLKTGLEAEGFAADVAHDGVDGLWMAREHPYDAIVLDIMLPGMNGYRVCAEPARGGHLDADPDAHREGRRVRRGRGARHRRRRLRHEAVLLRRARRSAAGADPARRGRATGGPRGRGSAVRPGRPARRGAAGRRSASPPARRRCSSSCCAARARSCRRPRSSTTSGTIELRRRPEHRRGLRAAPAGTSSTGRSAAARSRRSAAPATVSPTTVGDGAREPAGCDLVFGGFELRA